MSAAAKLAEMKSAKATENAKKAEAEYAAGKKHISTGFFGLSKPDWETAAREFQEAAKLFALCGPAYSKTMIDACIQCATAYEKQDQYHPAAQHYEKAAQETAKTQDDLKHAANLYRTAARMYRLGESPDKGAAVFMKAANTVGEVDVKLAMELCSDACAVFEDENRGMFANDTFKQAINYYVKKQKYSEAIGLLYRQNKVYTTHIKTFENDLYKNLLTIIVLRFQLTEYEQAEKDYKDAMSVFEFGRSDESNAADALLDAWTQGSTEALAKAIKMQTFTFLANSVAQLVPRLRFDEAKLKAANAARAAVDAKEAGAAAAVAAGPGAPAVKRTAEGELDLQ